MNDRLQLFFDNTDKINLYFGSQAETFGKNLALKLTMRNLRFHYEDYERVQQQIKTVTKWYQFVVIDVFIIHSYYVHYAKTPEQIPATIHMYKKISKRFGRGAQSYLTAMHLKSAESHEKLHELITHLKQLPSLRFSNLPPNQCAILATRPEDAVTLAQTYEHYYEALLSIGFIRTIDTKNTALLLTVGTGTFCKKTFEQVTILSNYIRKTEISVLSCRYQPIALLALSNFDVSEFPALFDIHAEICRKLKIKSGGCNSLLLATQIYTSNEVMGDLRENELDFSDFAYALINNNFDTGSSDGDSFGGGND